MGINPIRISKLEQLLSEAASRPISPRDMTDDQLWAIILSQAGVPTTQDNITIHRMYNDTRTDDRVWIKMNDEWVDASTRF